MCTAIGLVGEASSLRETGEPRLLGKEGRPHSQGTIKKSQTKNNIVREEDQKESMARDSSQHRLSSMRVTVCPHEALYSSRTLEPAASF